MTNGILHHKQSGLPADEGNSAHVEPSDWYAAHDLDSVAPSGLTGATGASRYVGGTTGGAPTSGTFAVGDFVVDQSGKVWICTVAGTPGTWTSGSQAAATIGAKVTHNTTQSTTTTPAAVAFNSETGGFDTDGFHDTSTNNSHLTVPAGLAGKYLCAATVEVASSNPHLAFYVNGTKRWDNARSGGVTGDITAVFDLAVGDYVEVFCDISTGTQNIASGNNSPWFTMYKLDSGRVGQGIGCRAVSNSLTSLSTGADTAVALAGADDYDTDGFHDPASNNTRVTIPTGLGGLYLIVPTCTIVNNTNTPTDRRVSIRKTGSTSYILQREYWASATSTTIYLTGALVLHLDAGDYVEMMAFCDAASSQGGGQLQVLRLDSGTGNYTGPLWGSGTVFPSGPADGQRYTRTDRNIDYFWSASVGQWLTVQHYQDDISLQDNLAAQTTNFTAAYGVLEGGQYNVYVERVIISTTVATTNNGSNYWTVTVNRRPSATALGSFNTSADTANTNTDHSFNVNALTGTTDRYYSIDCVKTGTPGGLYVLTKIRYRLVG